MNLNSNSPFSGKPLSECDERELDSWCAARCGYTVALFENDWYFCDVKNPGREIPTYGTSWADAGPLMERDEFQRVVHAGIDDRTFFERLLFEATLCNELTPRLIRHWFIIAATQRLRERLRGTGGINNYVD